MCGKDETLEDLEFKLYKALRYENYDTVRSWLRRWREPHRFYHDRSHLVELLKGIDHSDRWRPDVMLAALFHDIIYDPTRNDNEQRSADFFMSEMPAVFAEENRELMESVHKAILETKHDKPAESELGKIICTADLKVLTDNDLDGLVKYELKLSKEYQAYPYQLYKPERIKFLSKWVERNPEIAKLIEFIQHRKMNIGVYAGSFDPFTIGHQNILQKAERIFDKVIIARGLNTAKAGWSYKLPPCLDFHQKIYVGPKTVNRDMMVRAIGEEVYDIDCVPHLAHAMLENPGATLIRGLRGAADLESEKIQQIYVEKMLGKPLNAVYITCDREFDHISSSAFKQLVKVDKAQAALCCPNGIPEEL